jgi:hypothetical protein
VAHRLPAPIGPALLHAAEDAYAQGMSEVLLVTAALLFAGSVLMLLFLPARAHAAPSAAAIKPSAEAAS